MKAIHMKVRTDAGGCLVFQVPTGMPKREFDVDIVCRPANGMQDVQENEWPEGFFERTAGGWRGRPLARSEQGEYDAREELRPASKAEE